MPTIIAPWKRALQLASTGHQDQAEILFAQNYPHIVARDRPAPGTIGLSPWRVAIMQAAGPAGIGAAKVTMKNNYPELFGTGWKKARRKHSRHRRGK